MGIDWPLSPVWFALLIFLICFSLWLHSKSLLNSTLPKVARKLIVLRSFVVLLLIILIARPYFTNEEPDVSRMKLVVLSDLSGSMDAKDQKAGSRRIDEVKPFLNLRLEGSWMNRMRGKYGKVDRLGFSHELKRMNNQSWSEPELGNKTAIGDALQEILSKTQGDTELGAVVLFSDGLNNHGRSVLDVANEYRARGIPVNVIGVGRNLVRGDVRVSFLDRKPTAVAKEELLLTAEVENLFKRSWSTEVKLYQGDEILHTVSVDLKSGEKRKINFPPQLPGFAGPKRYRLSVDSPEGDSDPSNDTDSLLVIVKPPEQFSILYMSNQVRPLYSFIKRVLGNQERFDLNSVIRLGENVFHAFGEKVRPAYPVEENFWMDFDAIILDLETLSELNATVIPSLKDFVQKRGGGLLTFGPLENGRKILGGLLPAKEVEQVLAKDNLSLRVYEEPLFTDKDQVGEMKPFIPDRLPGYFISQQNKGARGVVVSKANGKPVLSVQAYGAGKAAYWGIPDDWRRAIINEDGANEFRVFWQSLIQWLGEGGEDRLKLEEKDGVIPKGSEAVLQVNALGSDFEPAMDAMVSAEINGPDGTVQTIDLYPQGANAGQYNGSFRTKLPGAYQVKYNLSFPDGEELKTETFLRVSETGEESKDLSYAERDLKMLANLTAGDFLSISNLKEEWEPRFAESIPVLRKKAGLTDFWPVFILLFLACGLEWIWRRQAGLK